MLKFVPLDLSEFSNIDHFRCKSPLPFPVKPLLVKPLPVSTSGGILPRIADTADLVFDSLLCMFDSFFCGSTHVCAVRFIFRLVRLILVQLDLFLCVSLYLYTVRFIFVRFDLCLCRFDSIFVRFDSLFGPFDLFLRGSIHFLLF